MNLYTRACRLVLGSLVIEGLRTQFKVTKTLAKEPNQAELQIYNLTQAHRKDLQKVGQQIILEAGYVGSLGRIFSGQTRYVDAVREGPDWITKVQSGDGETAYRYSVISQTFGSNTFVKDALKQVADATGLDTSAVASAFTSLEKFGRGHAVHGKTAKALDDLLKGRGYEWSIQDGKLQILATGASLTNRQVVLNASSGLIGSPEHGSPPAKGKPAALKVKCLLQPLLVPGGRFTLEAESVSKSDFRCEKVIHTGDSAGKDWYTEVEAFAV